MSDITGFWIGYAVSLFIQLIVWSGIVYLLFTSLSKQIKRSPYEKILKFLFVPLTFFIIKMSQGVLFFTWNNGQFIWGSCIILLFTAADLFLKAEKRQEIRIWWEGLGNFDYMLIGLAAGLALYTSLLMVIGLFTGWEIILLIFPIIWFVFLGCLQTRNGYYSRKGRRNAVKQEKESRCFLLFFCKLMIIFSCLMTLSVQFMRPLGWGLLLFDVIVLAVAVIVPLYVKLNKETILRQFLFKHAGAEYGLLFLSSVIINFIYSDETRFVLRAIGGYMGGLPDFI